MHTSEQEARAHSRELEATFEAMADAVFVHDTQEQLGRTNPTAHTIFDLERQPDAPSHPREEHADLFRFRVKDIQMFPKIAYYFKVIYNTFNSVFFI